MHFPVLPYPNFNLHFILTTDGSQQGCIKPKTGGIEYVIVFASRGLHAAEKNERNYVEFKLELLTLK